MPSRSPVKSVVLAAALAVGLVAPIGAATPAFAAIRCTDAGSGGSSGFYPGESASDVYDDTFAKAAAIPGLPTYTPQGLTTWENWDGKGNDLLVMGAYRKGHTSRLYGIDPSTYETVGAVKVKESHLGGIAAVGTYLIAQNRQSGNTGEIRKYKLSALAKAMKASGTPSLSTTGRTQQLYDADFMTAYKGQVWSGRFSTSGNDKMYRYNVSSAGKLTKIGSAYEIPPKTQGVLVTSDTFVFNTGLSAGKIWVTKRQYDLEVGRCFTSPSHGENFARVGNEVFLDFEGGSGVYDSPDTRNKIKHLHRASLTTLRSLEN